MKKRFSNNQLLLTGTLLLGSLLGSSQLSAQASVDYDEANNWLCRPDNLRACGTDLTTTVVAADGSQQTEQFSHDPMAPVDCFYVYPTVSRDSTPNSDMEAGPEEMNVIASQFARLGSACRLYAPLYRQVTLTALRAGLSGGGGMSPDRELGYNDVVNAWNHYLANDNNGRGVVLVGHSQGSGVLARLISEEIEGKDVQEKIISAMLLGTNVQVPKGKLVGGTFEHLPLCQTGSETGCIITYASFRNDIPPPDNSLFGRGRENTEAACTNPAQLAGGSNELHAYLSNNTVEGASSAPPAPWRSNGDQPQTPFVSVPGLLTASCVNNGTFNYLEVTVNADPSDPRTDKISGDVMANGQITASWGLHLIDVNVAMGDLVTIVEKQSASWQQK